MLVSFTQIMAIQCCMHAVASRPGSCSEQVKGRFFVYETNSSLSVYFLFQLSSKAASDGTFCIALKSQAHLGRAYIVLFIVITMTAAKGLR